MEIRGQIIDTGPDGFQLREVNELQSETSIIGCKYDNEVEESKYALVKGRMRAELTGPGSVFAYFEVESIGYITELDAQSETTCKQTYFVDDNLNQLQFKDAKEFFNFLKNKAFLEGFKLTHKKSLKEKSITFRCDKHSLYGKSQQLNCNCQFKICIVKSNLTGFYHVSSFFNQHSHFTNPSIYAHLTLSQDIQDLILNMFHSNILSSQILTFLRNAHGINLSSQQLQILSRHFKPQVEASETQEVIEYMN